MSALVLLLASCGGEDATPTRAIAPATAIAHATEIPETSAPPVVPATAVGPDLLVAPERYAGVVPRQTFPFGARYVNLVYEGNNVEMRGRGERAAGDAVEVRDRWRRFASGVRKVVVLRDSLFSQQDHPTNLAPAALMMPPSWVTAALVEVEAGRALRPVRAPAAEDDGAWTAIASASEMFGSFPPSERLFALAARATAGATPADRSQTRAARASVRSLARNAAAMVEAAAGGVDAVARAGAEAIAASDRAYFGDAIRREHVLPIFVENPTRHELEDEGKGFALAGRDVPDAIVARARDAIVRRRLADGDVAIERYDLSLAQERRRAIALVEAIVPRGAASSGGDVWLWVNGPLDAAGIRGEDATAYVEDFRRELAAARIDPARVRLFSKPHVDLPAGPARAPAFEAAVDRFRALDLPLSVNLDTRALRRLLSR